MSDRRLAREYIRSTDFEQWTRQVHAIAYYRDQGRLDKAVTIKKVDELIERGMKFKREMNWLPHDKWAHTMFLLKKMRKEMASET